MDGETFDRFTRRVAHISRRDVARALLFAATALPLTPVRIARAELEGVVVLGGACTASTECRQDVMQAEAICADNGFTADGERNCCVERGCCVGDGDCCGDLRCAPAPDVCNVCLMPPFPTRMIGQVCASDAECVPSVICEATCVDKRCVCRDKPQIAGAADRANLPDVPDADSALAAAEELSRLEATGQFERLYDLLHPDAKAIIPFAVVSGWYENESRTLGASAAEGMKIRFIPWTWDVNGRLYPETAEVAFRQTLSDGTVIRDEVRLVKDGRGAWHWFFGRDRAFVEQQIARYGS
jgi:hypothetical protein